jgi:hypothetical protein
MEVFISRGGERSKAVARILREWLPSISNGFKPWMSEKDIDQGARWSAEIARKLEESRAGIILLTPENMHNDWIIFEAGALSKLGQSRVCALLINLDLTDLTGPLTQFQNARLDRDGLWKVVESLNKSARAEEILADERLVKTFDVIWPRIESELKSSQPVEGPRPPKRTDRELLEEILGILRDQKSSDVASYTAAVLNTLDPMKKRVIEGLFGLGGGTQKTAEQVARELGVSKARVEMLATEALRELRHPIRPDSFETSLEPELG